MNLRHGRFAAALAALLALSATASAQTKDPGAGKGSDSLLNITPPPILSPAGVVSSPPDFPRGRVAGVMVGDFYYNAEGDPRHGYNAALADTVNPVFIDGSGRPIGRDLNGLLIRRVYIQVDNDLSYRFSTRVRLEADSRALSSDGKIGVFIKGAYLRWRSIFPRADAFFGMINTPTFQGAEDFWSYRSIEKTITDFRGIASSSDLGVGLNGFVDSDHHVGYSVMLGNDTGQRPETNRQKRIYASIPLRWSDWRLEPGADYAKVPGGRDRALYKAFLGYERTRIAVGVEAFIQILHAPTGPFQEPRGISVFARGTATSSLGAFARFDTWSPDQRAANRVDQRFWIAGLDYMPIRDIHVMPNVEAMTYRARGTAVAPAHRDLQLRLTLAYSFARPQS